MICTENIVDLSGQIIASARFDDQTPDVPDDYYFYHYDKRGSTTAIVMPDGSLITGYSYDEFGNLERSGNGGFLNETTFTGSVTDTSTGLQYMNARYYNPETGRFLSQDTYSGNVYEPWTQHLYSYCGNNPVNMIDPTGHRPVMGDNPKDEVWKKEGDSWKLKGSNVVLKPAVVRPEEKWIVLYGFEGGASGFFRGSVSYQYAFDSEGNFGIVTTTGFGGALSGLSANGKYSYIEGYDLTQISGESISIALSGSYCFVDVAFEGIWMDGNLSGGSFSAGVSVGWPVDFNGEQNNTTVEIYGTAATPFNAFIGAQMLATFQFLPEEQKREISSNISSIPYDMWHNFWN